jgi:nucleoside-diphosphate kinase
MLQQTLAIVKPDAVRKGYTGKIIDRILSEGLNLRAMKLAHLTAAQAAGFYAVHTGKPFFGELCAFMTSGPVVLMMLEGEEAIARWRGIMGATNPANAAEGTLRKLFAESIQNNAVHGSDAPETAAFETGYFFNVFDRV